MSSKKIVLVGGAIVLLGIVLAAGIIFWLNQKEQNPAEPSRKVSSESATPSDVIPQNTKNPEEFMQKVQEKAQEMQKNYDSNLAAFAEKKWKKFFIDQNGLDSNYLADQLKVLTSEVEKDSSGNTLFKIKYRIGSGGAGPENEDYFFLVLTAAKLQELGLNELKPNAFLTEEDIKKNLGKAGFAKITKIQK